MHGHRRALPRRALPPALPSPLAPQNISGSAAHVEASIGTALAATQEPDLPDEVDDLPDEIDAVSDDDDDDDGATPPPPAAAPAPDPATAAETIVLPLAAASSAPAADALPTAPLSALAGNLRPDRGTSVVSGESSPRIRPSGVDDWLLEVCHAPRPHCEEGATRRRVIVSRRHDVDEGLLEMPVTFVTPVTPAGGEREESRYTRYTRYTRRR